MVKAIEAVCAAKLREIRRKRGLTLQGFEALSGGRVKAVVLGSYERGTRAVSLERLELLADLYEGPIHFFLGSQAQASSIQRSGFIFDLRRIGQQRELTPQLDFVKRYISLIAQKRSDWNGEVISLREIDSEALALICEKNLEELSSLLKLHGFLFASETSGQRSL